MANDSFEILYAAHTASCTFLLDADGICRRIVMQPSGKRRDPSKTASRCVGAQYVASLDGGVAGCLVEMPRIGAAMLFARVDERGRVSLVRTGVVTRFETRRPDDPFEQTAEEEGVETSAPDITPRVPQTARVAQLPAADPYAELSERTQPIQALRPEELAQVLHDDHAHELKTAEYASEPAARRSTLPSPSPPPQLRTLRHPPVKVADEDDPYVAHAQASSGNGMLPRRSDPYSGKRAADRTPRASEPVRTPRWVPDRAAVTRRRGER